MKNSVMNIYDYAKDHLFEIICVASLILVGYLLISEDKNWREFSSANGCKIISKTASTTLVTTSVLPVGTTTPIMLSTTYIPETNTYLCNDGKTYIR